MKTIGVISDTHINLGGKRRIPPIVFETFKNVDFILHAGDLNVLQVVSELETLAPVFMVHGNNEEAQTFATLATSQRIEVEDCVIGLVHGDLPLGAKPPKPLMNATGNRETAANAISHFENDEAVNCIIFGHSHISLQMELQIAGREMLLFNPGSASDRRREPQHSCGLLHVDGKRINAELIYW